MYFKRILAKRLLLDKWESFLYNPHLKTIPIPNTVLYQYAWSNRLALPARMCGQNSPCLINAYRISWH